MIGKVIQINIKSKDEFSNDPNSTGLPKYSVETVNVNKFGVGDDYNHYRKISKNNTPNRAVLIYTEDMITQLNEEGWQIKAGDMGENFTVADVPYEFFIIGKKYSIGEITIEITEKCNPCKNLTHLSYVGEKVGKFIKTLKNRRGWYGKVLIEGKVSKGDHITLLV